LEREYSPNEFRSSFLDQRVDALGGIVGSLQAQRNEACRPREAMLGRLTEGLAMVGLVA
jgi:hypothetical protein